MIWFLIHQELASSAHHFMSLLFMSLLFPLIICHWPKSLWSTLTLNRTLKRGQLYINSAFC